MAEGGRIQRAHHKQRYRARPGHRRDLDSTESVSMERCQTTKQETTSRIMHTYLRQFKKHARQNNRLGINVKDMYTWPGKIHTGPGPSGKGDKWGSISSVNMYRSKYNKLNISSLGLVGSK